VIRAYLKHIVKPTSQVRFSSLANTTNITANAFRNYAWHIDELASAGTSNCHTEQTGLSDRKPAFVGISRDICGFQVRDKNVCTLFLRNKFLKHNDIYRLLFYHSNTINPKCKKNIIQS
jgi:hypothetical protein